MPESQAIWIKIVDFLLLTSLLASLIFFATVSIFKSFDYFFHSLVFKPIRVCGQFDKFLALIHELNFRQRYSTYLPSSLTNYHVHTYLHYHKTLEYQNIYVGI